MGVVLVTGAFGLVGAATVNRLAAEGHAVVATDLGTTANRRAARKMPQSAQARWADLTDHQQVDALVAEVSPAVIVHLAAVIPPHCYRNVRLAHAVNVNATAALVRAACSSAVQPRFVHASSVAVYGARNPHRSDELLQAGTPPSPVDCYGQHKVEAEAIVRESPLEWVILRLGGVLSADLRAMGLAADSLFMEAAMPVDGRIQTVDVRDVAFAFAAATSADVAGETLLIGGDASHRLRQGDLGPAMTAAIGLGAFPTGRPGNPADDDAWFVCDWMDTRRAQEALAFQGHSWPDMLAEMRARIGWLRYPARVTAPVVGEILKRRSPYYRQPVRYADPWGVIGSRWPDWRAHPH